MPGAYHPDDAHFDAPPAVPAVVWYALAVVILSVAGLFAIAEASGTIVPDRASHLPRTVSTWATLLIGSAVGVWALARRWWRVAAAVGLVAVVVAVSTWWFVPAENGLTLWHARQLSGDLAARFDQLAADDSAGFRAVRDDADRLVATFGNYRPAISAATDGWMLRAEDAAALGGVRPGDWDGYRRGARLRADLSVLFPTRYPLRERAITETEWGSRSAMEVVAAAKAITPARPAEARVMLAACGKELRGLPVVDLNQERFLAARTELLKAALDAARWEAQSLLKADRAADLSRLSDALAAEFAADIGPAGLTAEVRTFRGSCAYLSELARRAAGPTPR